MGHEANDPQIEDQECSKALLNRFSASELSSFFSISISKKADIIKEVLAFHYVGLSYEVANFGLERRNELFGCS
jgi:hypothetical protein